MKTFRNRRGLSIMELVATLLIMGILAGLGSVTYGALLDEAEASVSLSDARDTVRGAFTDELYVNAGVLDEDAVQRVVDSGEDLGFIVVVDSQGQYPQNYLVLPR